jgi:NitT/TauT family transport system substrate-binding protein
VARKGIARLADLRGRRIGLAPGSAGDVVLRRLLQAGGLDPTADVTLVPLAAATLVEALRGGAVEAVALGEPGLGTLESADLGTVLGRDADVEEVRERGSAISPEVLLLHRGWAEADLPRAERFLVAYYLGVEWVKQHREAAADLAALRTLVLDASELRSRIGRLTWYGLEKQKQLLTDAGLVGLARWLGEILAQETRTLPAVPAVDRCLGTHLLPSAP